MHVCNQLKLFHPLFKTFSFPSISAPLNLPSSGTCCPAPIGTYGSASLLQGISATVKGVVRGVVTFAALEYDSVERMSAAKETLPWAARGENRVASP